MKPSSPDLSVIILNYNTREYLGKLLQSLVQSDTGSLAVEIIVVDNGSEDGSQDLVRQQYRQVRLVENDRNFGFAKANNIGARFARGRYLLFLNSDTQVVDDAIGRLWRFQMQTEEYAGGTPCLILPSGRIDPSSHRGFPTPWNALCYFCGLEWLLGRIPAFGGYHQKWKDMRQTHPVDCISGACFFIRGDIFRKMGGWDESYFMYGEDVDLCYQLAQNGYKLFFYPKAKVIHYKRRSGREKQMSKENEQHVKHIQTKTKEHFFYTMKIFYEKNYRHKYPKLIYRLVLYGIKIISIFRN